MNFLSQSEDKQQHKILYQYDLRENVKSSDVVEIRYRKTDETDDNLIIVLKEELEVLNINSNILIFCKQIVK